MDERSYRAPLILIKVEKRGNMPKSDQGAGMQRYRVIPRTLIFVTHANQILLLKGGPHKKLWANRYNGFGGHIERGEDVLTSARRELWEEAGIQADLFLCGTVMIDVENDSGILLFVLRGETPSLTVQASEEGTPQWVGFASWADLPLAEDLPVLIPRVLSTERGQIFSARYYYDENDALQITFAE
jgi:8-oxo-dGTP diphosphatase